MWGGVLALVVAGGAILAWHSGFDWQALTRLLDGKLSRLGPAIVIPLMALLPVAGFPIMIVYLVAGARFGPAVGGLVVAGVTSVHLLLSYAITRSFLRAPLQRFLARRHRHFPQVEADEHAAVALIATLVPGLPYAVRNYALALAGVRLAVYFWVCLPVYVARSYVTIFLGDMGSDPPPGETAHPNRDRRAEGAICAGLLWWLRVHHRRFHGAPVRASVIS
jgi:uncharacterized membrane protein YdjX (TVP38/TMEM64 family)